MPPPSDHALLQDFASTRSQHTFDQIVARHGPLVRGAIRRKVRDPGLADDATQAVFLVLAQKAPTLKSHTPLASWLLKTARFAAIDLIRKESRHARHQRQACASRPESIAPAAVEDDPRLAAIDDALLALATPDREVLLLRFHQDQSFAQIGIALGSTAEGARKRTARALARLRKLLAARGTLLSIGALMTLLLTARPAVASAIVPPVATSARALSHAQHILRAWRHARLRLLTAIGTSVIAAAFLLGYFFPSTAPAASSPSFNAPSSMTLQTDAAGPSSPCDAPKLTLAPPLHSALFLALVSTTSSDASNEPYPDLAPQPAKRVTCLVLGIQWTDEPVSGTPLVVPPLQLTLNPPATPPTGLSAIQGPTLSIAWPFAAPKTDDLTAASPSEQVSPALAPGDNSSAPLAPDRPKIRILATVPVPRFSRF